LPSEIASSRKVRLDDTSLGMKKENPYIPQITPDWDKMMAEASDDAAKINQICGASNG